MIIKNAEFITSAANVDGFRSFNKPIICVSGRSNVGKSSFINALARQKKLAKTSNTPGRTRLVNYFDFGEFVIADLPGYGYAEVSREEKEKWAKTLDDFFKLTKISHVFALVDMRHAPSGDDLIMLNFLYGTILPFTVIATKSDKIPKTKRATALKNLASSLKLGVSDIIATSSESGEGRDKVLALLDKIVRTYNLPDEDGEDFDSDEDDN